MIKRHTKNILTFIKHKIVNAFTEVINNKIQHTKATAQEFRNSNNYKNLILFYCDRLDLDPQ